MLAARYWLPQDISAHGSTIDQLIGFLHYFMFVLFIGWGIFFVYCLLKFRARGGATARYEAIKAKPSKYAEIVVICIEAALLIGLSMPVWASYRDEPPGNDQNPLTVRVIAQQFAWNMHYPGPDGKFGKTKPGLVDETMNPIGLDESDPAAGDDIVSINNFYVPKGRDVIVRLSSKDVIHSFAVPMLRVKQDAIPGMEIPLWFKAEKSNDEVRASLVKTVTLPSGEDPDEIEAFLTKHRNDVFMADYAKGVAVKGGWVDEDTVAALVQAGIGEVEVAPKHPVNIQCAQLCGLGHYRMLGQMQILEPEAFAAWEKESSAEDEFFDEDEFDDEDEDDEDDEDEDDEDEDDEE
ncbi:MAG: cytochrome c oxidase subunit II [Rhodobacteraceae bacterium]|jgi:cytochrome c oxidase subunit 2|nr:cytochrome c oxidase subunit II [Paracoccaceae bacterium]